MYCICVSVYVIEAFTVEALKYTEVKLNALVCNATVLASVYRQVILV